MTLLMAQATTAPPAANITKTAKYKLVLFEIAA